MDETIGLSWRYEVWLRHSQDSQCLVKSGNTRKRYEAMQLVSEMLRDVEPVEVDAYATVALDGRDDPRPLKLSRAGGKIIGWTGVSRARNKQAHPG